MSDAASWSKLVNVKTPPEAVQPRPYENLPGSDVGNPSAPIAQSTNELFPILDGEGGEGSLSPENRPADFDEPPADLDPASFLKWHSAYQLEYIKTHIGSADALAIGGTGSTIHVMLSDTRLKLYVVENLDKTALARLTVDEQARLAGMAAFTARLDGLQMSVNGAAATALVEAQIAKINASSAMSAADKKVFTDQLENLKLQLATMRIFSLNDIKSQVDAIDKRFVRVDAFSGPWNEGTLTEGNEAGEVWNFPTQVVSLDGGETIRKGYTVFMAQERQILALQNARLELAGLAPGGGTTPALGKLDVPMLVYALQLNYNLQNEALIAVETEEINQTNALLKTYAEMQKLVNDTIKAFDPTKQDETRSIGNYVPADQEPGDSHAMPASDAAQLNRVLSMFENNLGTLLSPIEKLKGITRTTQDMFDNDNNDLKKWTKATWDTFSSQLADRVTLINQESQIKMNEVNALDKQKNRHFDLANNALAKMAEIVQNISRASGD